jgi:hypothetical protein
VLSELPSLMMVVKVIYVLGQCYLLLNTVRLTENMSFFCIFCLILHLCE